MHLQNLLAIHPNTYANNNILWSCILYLFGVFKGSDGLVSKKLSALQL